jgi:hypothetical protein
MESNPRNHHGNCVFRDKTISKRLCDVIEHRLITFTPLYDWISIFLAREGYIGQLSFKDIEYLNKNLKLRTQ